MHWMLGLVGVLTVFISRSSHVEKSQKLEDLKNVAFSELIYCTTDCFVEQIQQLVMYS